MVQKLGVGSILYVLFLALVIYGVTLPLRPRRWSYVHVLTFVGLTAPPAALYAVPAERFLGMADAARLNLWFLFVVAAWRLALYFSYLRCHAGLGLRTAIVAVLLPITLVISALWLLGFARGVFTVMGGIRDSSADAVANEVVFGLGLLSVLAFVPLLVAWGVAVAALRARG